MAVTEEKTTIYRCSDGRTTLSKAEANFWEAEGELRRVCDEHGYSAPSFSRDLLYDVLREHVEDFAVALTNVVTAYDALCAERATKAPKVAS